MDFNINLNTENQIIYNNSVSEIKKTEDDTSVFDNTENLELDGEIGFTRQSREKGECWLLSGLNVLSYSERGREILQNAITENDDGSYSVYFKGVNTKVTVTQDRLQNAKQSNTYSTGDDDVLLLELAFESVIDEIQNGNIKVKGYHPYLTVDAQQEEGKTSLDGGSFDDVVFLLAGKDTHTLTNKKIYDRVLNRIEKDNNYLAAILVIGEDDTHANQIIQDIYGNDIFKVPALGSHAFSVKSVDGDNVVITNPHNSEEEYIISRETLKEYTKYIEFCLL